jgi:predicted NUDIX family NTP pyrophosphohydrolase
MLAENRSPEELEELDIRLGMVPDPEEEALAALRAHQEETGMKFENPDAPVGGDGKWPGAELPWP